MRIVSFTRSTPDTAANVEVDGSGKVVWDGANIVNPWDEYALEEAIARAKETGGQATVIAVGEEAHEEALKHSLAMGMNDAVRVYEDGLDSSDSLTWATLAAAAVEKVGEVKLVICGKESIDVQTDQHIYQTARKLGWIMLSNVSKILDLSDGSIKVERTTDTGVQQVTAQFPAVITVLKGINEPRYPSFIGIRKASKAAIPVWSSADLGVTLPQSATEVMAFENLPARDMTTEIIEGGSVEEKATKLVDRLLEEKVL
ncbi:MAG: electron transfer flavoprotein subunit beta/FixA family protein [Anaerolineae bacterium]|nr:electron transfer flavoprotein subunit beta/FixA family protein [Anaerolineae bacterium]MCA9887628.1 electron transfer flavoprotein subunit beta/FixA family protein [Anaerolineae bacterium]